MMEKLSFEDLCLQIKDAPMSWLPALLAVVISAAIKKKSFKDPDAILCFVEATLPQKTMNQ